MRLALICGALLGLCFRWRHPSIAAVSLFILLLTVVEGLVNFVQIRVRFARLVRLRTAVVLTLARAPAQLYLGSPKIHP